MKEKRNETHKYKKEALKVHNEKAELESQTSLQRNSNKNICNKQ